MIRVMEVKFFANNTFATVAGLGGNILRGKFDIIGHDRDQLWMQVWRFGFGRSVSGSVYRYVANVIRNVHICFCHLYMFILNEASKRRRHVTVLQRFVHVSSTLSQIHCLVWLSLYS